MSRKTFKKVITSDEHWENVNPKNKELMKEFLEEKNIRSSDTTIKGYESDLKIFFTWNYLYNGNLFFPQIKKLQFSKFFGYVTNDLKWGSSRFSRMRSVLSTVSNFIEKYMDEEYPNFRNVILKCIENMPKVVRREKTILKDEQIESLLDYLKNTDKQKACWVALAITSGARFSELLRFDTDIIDENRVAFGDLFLETTKQIKTKGRGKSGKPLYKYILRDKFLPFYRDWIEERKVIMEKNNKDNKSLFIRNDGEPLTEPVVRGWIKEFEKYLKGNFYSHCLRHYLTTMLSKKNIPSYLIKELMGWSSLEMVEVYNDSAPKDRSYPELENLRSIP